MSTDQHEPRSPDGRLRAALVALDPIADATTTPIDPITSDRARTLLEAIMSTPLLDDATPNLSDTGTAPRDRRRWFALGGAGVVAAAVVALIASNGASPTVTATELGLTPVDPAMSMCMVFEPSQLAGVEVAFGGTVTEITGDQASGSTIRIEVDRWFRGGDTDVVDLTVPAGFTAALDGVDFVVGTRYLVTAVDGVVTSCGLSGPATPEFEQIFTDVFA